MKYFIEACCPTLESVRHAVAAGAGRIELCEQLEVGGVTPSETLIRAALQAAGDVPVNVLIRPRSGDFVYTQAEVEQMLESIRLCRALGVNGVVVGALTADGDVDKATTARLISAARPLSITFHRAFDEARDLPAALEDIIGLGAHRILTSGGRPTAYEGRYVLRDIIALAAGRITIMPGCGVHPSNIDIIASVTGASEFHGSRLLSEPLPIQ